METARPAFNSLFLNQKDQLKAASQIQHAVLQRATLPRLRPFLEIVGKSLFFLAQAGGVRVVRTSPPSSTRVNLVKLRI